MRKVTLIVAALVATIIAVPAVAQQDSQCEVDRLMDDLMNGEAGNLLNTYMMKASLDYKNYCGGNSDQIDMAFYKRNNKKIGKILRKYHCTWDDVPKFRKMETVGDVCHEEGGLALVPLVPSTTKKCRTEEFSKIVEAYDKAIKEDSKNCKNINLEKYRVWNAELDVVLRKADCTWEDVTGFQRVETYADLGCKPPPKKPVAAKPDEDDVALPVVPLVPEEDETKKPDAGNKKPADDKGKVALKPPPEKKEPAIDIKKTPPPPAKSYWLTYTGIGVGVAGLAVLGGGTYFGLQANEAADNAKGAVTQLDVDRFNRDASDNAANANIMLGVGGAMVAAGAVMVILDLTVWGSPADTSADKSVTTSIGMGSGSAHLEVRF